MKGEELDLIKLKYVNQVIGSGKKNRKEGLHTTGWSKCWHIPSVLTVCQFRRCMTLLRDLHRRSTVMATSMADASIRSLLGLRLHELKI
ncbi:hypothetical protein JHK87_019966 [Glycine soja]|nr:hypothetical protein JHK87_019966 [Glycine soja]